MKHEEMKKRLRLLESRREKIKWSSCLKPKARLQGWQKVIGLCMMVLGMMCLSACSSSLTDYGYHKGRIIASSMYCPIEEDHTEIVNISCEVPRWVSEMSDPYDGIVRDPSKWICEKVLLKSKPVYCQGEYLFDAVSFAEYKFDDTNDRYSNIHYGTVLYMPKTKDVIRCLEYKIDKKTGRIIRLKNKEILYLQNSPNDPLEFEIRLTLCPQHAQGQKVEYRAKRKKKR